MDVSMIPIRLSLQQCNNHSTTNTPTPTQNTNRSQKKTHIRFEVVSSAPSSRFLRLTPPSHTYTPLPLHTPPICSARHTCRSPLLLRTPPSIPGVSLFPGGMAGIVTGSGPLRCVLYFSSAHLPPFSPPSLYDSRKTSGAGCSKSARKFPPASQTCFGSTLGFLGMAGSIQS